MISKYVDNKDCSGIEKMTHEPVRKLVIRLAIPSLMIMVVTNIYNLADTAFVSQLGNSASGAIGVIFGFMAIIQAFGFLFGQGTGSIVGRYIGEEKFYEVNQAASTGIIMSIFAGILISGLGFIFQEKLTVFWGSTVTIKPYADIYMYYILAACPAMTSSITMNVILRYEGKAALGAIGMMTGAGLNIIGDAVFVNLLHMGIGGAGLSTFICQIISFTILMEIFLKGKSTSRVSWQFFKLKSKILIEIIETGFPSLVRQSLGSFATVLLNVYAAFYGDEVVAAIGIASRIISFILSIATGVIQGFLPVAGINYGAEKYVRVKRAYYFTILFTEGIILVFVMILFWKTEYIMSLFRDDSTVIMIGQRVLKWQGTALLALPFCVCTEMLLQSTGQKLITTILTALRSGVYFIPVLMILSKIRGLEGIQEAQAITFIMAGISAIPVAVWYVKKLDFMEKQKIKNER